MELINEQAFQDIFKAEVKEFLQKNKPWQSIAITTATVLIFVGAIVCLCVLNK